MVVALAFVFACRLPNGCRTPTNAAACTNAGPSGWTTPDDAPLRETIEVRVLALFDEDTDREARRARFQAQVPKALPNGVVSSWAAR